MLPVSSINNWDSSSFHVAKLHSQRLDIVERFTIEQASTRNDWRCPRQFLYRDGPSVWRRQKGRRVHYSRASCRSHIHKYYILMKAFPANPTNAFDGGVTLSMEQCNALCDIPEADDYLLGRAEALIILIKIRISYHVVDAMTMSQRRSTRCLYSRTEYPSSSAYISNVRNCKEITLTTTVSLCDLEMLWREMRNSLSAASSPVHLLEIQSSSRTEDILRLHLD